MIKKTAKHVTLVGPMGAGKSFVGEQLAARLKLPFIDIDQQIEAACGMTVQQIFSHQGEAAFRVLEEQELEKALALPSQAVIATGGGCVLAQNNRDLIQKNGWVVYLVVSASTAIARCQDSKQLRPLLQDENPLAIWEAISHERQTHYDALADKIFNTDDLSADELVMQIATAWEKQNED